MKHRYKVKFDSQLKETKVTYYNVRDIHKFRLAYVKAYLETYDECIISINTNLIQKTIDTVAFSKLCETYFKAQNYEYSIFPIPSTRDKKIFGFKIGTEQEKAFVILLKLPTAEFTEEFYDQILESCDYMMGLKLDRTFDALVQEFQKGYEAYLYQVEGFEKVLYDSVLIKAVRTNFDYFPEVDF